MNIAILGAGSIAGKMAGTLSQMEEVKRYAIAARDYDRALSFKETYGFERAYGSYEEMVQDEAVEMVYIATPHSHHFEHAKLCLEHGKHVLCEKPFTINEKEARELFRLAKEKNVFITEATWTRFMPSRKLIDEVIASGILGNIATVTANIGYPIMHKQRIMEPTLAGGALLDIGIYTINFALMVLGHDIEEVHSTAMLSDKGVDMQNSITLTFKDNKMAILNSSAMVAINRQGVIAGDKGYMVIENINNCEGITIYNSDHQILKKVQIPEQITGYEYEVRATVKAIQEGKLECEEMPHEETLRVMRLMDGLRREWGVIYPGEA